MKRAAIGVDVGATTIKSALVDEHGRILASREQPTPSNDAKTIAAAIITAADELRRLANGRARVAGVGFGLPNYSIGPNWVQTMCSNMPTLEGFPLRPALREAFGDSIAIDLDTHAATLAELRFGAGAGRTRLLNMVIGTGISCGIAIDGQILRFNYGTSGETGHLIVDPTGSRLCTCGGRGCLETFAGGWAIRSSAIERARANPTTRLARLHTDLGDLDASDVATLASEGDDEARKIVIEAGTAVGAALVSLMHVFRPHLILLGGGVAAAGEVLFAPIRETVDRLAAPFYLEQLHGIRAAALGPSAGSIGAAIPILFPS
jgi:glucokinase